MPSKKDAYILVVDDSDTSVYYLTRTLGRNNFKLMIAKNGAQALEMLAQERPDLILLDIVMPGMDGYEVCRKIKTMEAIKNIPIIFCTTNSETDDLVKGFEAGAVDYVTKPYKEAELLARIRTHIELKRAREEIETLQGIIPICANCKKIRDDEGIWDQIEHYIEQHSKALFSHGLCPDCAEELYGKEEWFSKSSLNKKKK